MRSSEGPLLLVCAHHKFSKASFVVDYMHFFQLFLCLKVTCFVID